MPRLNSFFCKHCSSNRRFEYIHRRHGFYELGHEDWHCVTCGGCDYRPSTTDHYEPDDAAHFAAFRARDVAWTGGDSTT
jgi:hypothetical protein